MCRRGPARSMRSPAQSRRRAGRVPRSCCRDWSGRGLWRGGHSRRMRPQSAEGPTRCGRPTRRSRLHPPRLAAGGGSARWWPDWTRVSSTMLPRMGRRPGLDASRLPTSLPRREGGRVPWLPAAGRPTLPERTGRPRLRRPVRRVDARRDKREAAELVMEDLRCIDLLFDSSSRDSARSGEREPVGGYVEGVQDPGAGSGRILLARPNWAEPEVRSRRTRRSWARTRLPAMVRRRSSAGPSPGQGRAAKVVVEGRCHEVEMLPDRVDRGLDADQPGHSWGAWTGKCREELVTRPGRARATPGPWRRRPELSGSMSSRRAVRSHSWRSSPTLRRSDPLMGLPPRRAAVASAASHPGVAAVPPERPRRRLGARTLSRPRTRAATRARGERRLPR